MPEYVEFRPDFARLRSINNEARSPDRLRAHFELECELASRLRASQPAERSHLYGELYTELFARLPDHPQHMIDPANRRRNTIKQVEFLRSFLAPQSIYVEVGCGDAAVTRSVATFVLEAVGVDVTPALINRDSAPANFRFAQTNGTDLDLPTDYADVVYSNQLMEHLHIDDARKQLQEICRVLKPGGRYICSTPSRITGPHDISVYFGYRPTGFHMREYDYGSLAAMFRDVGFRSAKALVRIKGIQMQMAVQPVSWAEKLILSLPNRLRAKFLELGPVRNLAGVVLIGSK